LEYHTVPLPVLFKLEDCVPSDDAAINIDSVIGSCWSDAAWSNGISTIIPPSCLWNSTLAQDPVEGRPPSTIIRIPKFESFFQMIRPMMAQTERRSEASICLSVLRSLLLTAERKDAKKAGQAWSATLVKDLDCAAVPDQGSISALATSTFTSILI
jgi:hypothetical protein